MIKPPDSSQGINTLNGILGLQQARQNLQTGQYNQQTAQANAQMTQQDAQQRSAAGSFFKNFDIAKHHGDDGTLDLDSALTSPEFKATGDSAPEIAKSLLAIKNSQLAAKTSLAGLNGTLRDQFSQQVAGLAQDPDVKQGNQTGRGKVLDAIDQFGKVGGPDAQRVAAIYGQVLQNTPPGKMGQALQNLQLQAKSAGEQLPQATTVDKGSQVIPGAVAPGSGVFTPAGPPVQKDIAPHVITTPAGPIATVGPKGTLSAAPTQGAGPNLNPTAAQQASTMEAAKGVAGRVQQAQAAANNTTQAQDALERARGILDQPDALNTGGGFEWKKTVKNMLAGAGIDTAGADDANTLVKNLARYEASRATQAGLGGTDAARELAHNGSPNVALDNKALKGVITQSLATEKALAGYAGVQAKTKDPDQLAKNETDFRNIPHLVQAYEYGLARTPVEAEEFLKKHGLSREEMAKSRRQIKEFESR
jgi:hypothetical protein